jgi:hypothetical protein
MNFKEIWFYDFEYISRPGERPIPVCMVAKELFTKKEIYLWKEELETMKKPPFPIDDSSLVVSYNAIAELSCHLVLGWPFPTHFLDLYVEFKNLMNGLKTPCGGGLIGALAFFGIDSIGFEEKERMIDLILSGGPWSEDQKREILEYCESDVIALEPLYKKMIPLIHMPHALHRSRFMKAGANIEHSGIPIDGSKFHRAQDCWEKIKLRLIQKIDANYGVYEGTTFKTAKFREYLIKNDIPWSHLESGQLALDDETFSEMSKAYPVLDPLRELRVTLSQMRLSNLTIGQDNRNRYSLKPFSSITGRNQPSTSKNMFGPAVWIRSFIQAPPGHGMAYIDWEQQEFAIAAALSEDQTMMESYRTGDPYIAFAKQAGVVPADATKETHGAIRSQYKECALGVQYGMSDRALAEKIGEPVARGQELIRIHKETYKKFWKWLDAVLNYAMLHGKIWTVFGWELHVGEKPNPRSIINFPMQANGAEMLRLACCLLVENGIKVCASVHDAILIEAPLEELQEVTQKAQDLMAEASEIVLGGFRLRSEAKIIPYPKRFQDPRGKVMWDTIMELVAEISPVEPDRKQSIGLPINDTKPVPECTPV